jgi:hypothetical protein
MELRRAARQQTSGSAAAFLMVVWPLAKTAANSRFSVPMLLG